MRTATLSEHITHEMALKKLDRPMSANDLACKTYASRTQAWIVLQKLVVTGDVIEEYTLSGGWIYYRNPQRIAA